MVTGTTKETRARFRGYRKQTVGSGDRLTWKEDTGDMIKQTQQTHDHKPKNILTWANHIGFGKKHLLDRDDIVASVGHVYLTGTAVRCLVAICLVAIYDLALREPRRIFGHLARRLKERVIGPAFDGHYRVLYPRKI